LNLLVQRAGCRNWSVVGDPAQAESLARSELAKRNRNCSAATLARLTLARAGGPGTPYRLLFGLGLMKAKPGKQGWG
jgi:hypothetical protein